LELLDNKNERKLFPAGKARNNLRSDCCDFRRESVFTPSEAIILSCFGQTYKPGSVFDNHLSKACRCRQARAAYQPGSDGPPLFAPYLALLRVGFTRPICYHIAGELLPHHFNLTTA